MPQPIHRIEIEGTQHIEISVTEPPDFLVIEIKSDDDQATIIVSQDEAAEIAAVLIQAAGQIKAYKITKG